jgi:hypothetical protein
LDNETIAKDITGKRPVKKNSGPDVDKLIVHLARAVCALSIGIAVIFTCVGFLQGSIPLSSAEKDSSSRTVRLATESDART